MVMMGMHLQLVGLVIGLIIPRMNCYKIKRTDCVLDNIDEQKMICTCGGIGDPFSIILNKGPKPELGVPYYGTRFGHNLAEQVKQKMVDLNISVVTEVLYHNCEDEALRVKIDFEEFPLDSFFQKDLTTLKSITFSHIHSVCLYLNSALYWGNITIKLEDIISSYDFGYAKEGSVIVFGHVEYCEEDADSCFPNSTLELEIDSVKDVLFQDLILSPLGGHGQCTVVASNVSTFTVEGGSYDGSTTIVDANECFGWEQKVNCTDMFEVGGQTIEDEEVTGLVIGAVAIVFVFLAIVGAVLGIRGMKV